MTQDFIQFKKQRKIGEIITETFRFLRENYRSYFRALLKLAGPVFLLLVAAVSYYTYNTINSSTGTNIFQNGGEFLISFGVLGLALLLYLSVLHATTYNFIKSYIRNTGTVDETEVRAGVKRDFGKVFGILAVSWVLVFAGLLLFLIPGIYLMVPLSIAGATAVFRNISLSEGISECFDLVKEQWWKSLGSVLLIWLVTYVISLVFQLPIIIYSVIKTLTFVQQGSSANPEGLVDWIYVGLSVIASLIQYVLYSIIPVGLAFLYFHLNERKNFTGTYETIENLGKNE